MAIAFGDDDYHTLEAKPASGENVEGHWGDLFSTHGNFEFAGFQLLRGSGEVYFDDLDEEELEDEYGAFMAQLEGTPMSDVEVLVQDNSDFWVAHPHRQNSHSKPLLVCLGHDDPDNPDGTRTTDDNPGTHFLRKMAAVLGVS